MNVRILVIVFFLLCGCVCGQIIDSKIFKEYEVSKNIPALLQILKYDNLANSTNAAEVIGRIGDSSCVLPLVAAVRFNQGDRIGGSEQIAAQEELSKALIGALEKLAGLKYTGDCKIGSEEIAVYLLLIEKKFGN